MRIDNWLATATNQLENAGIGTARLDALVLLEDATHKDRSWLLAHPEAKLTSKQVNTLAGNLSQRSKHIPLAYIRGKTEFYGREFLVTRDVLEPRPETEDMIDILKSLSLPPFPVIADIGTGSGALAITARLELPEATVIGVDIDENCLNVARKNSTKHTAAVEFLQSDLLDALSMQVDVILANLPYVPDNYILNDAAMMEPRIAIFGGTDGLDLYRRMFEQITKRTHMPQYVLTESLPLQDDDLQTIATAAGYQLNESRGLIQVFGNLNSLG